MINVIASGVRVREEDLLYDIARTQGHYQLRDGVLSTISQMDEVLSLFRLRKELLDAANLST